MLEIIIQKPSEKPIKKLGKRLPNGILTDGFNLPLFSKNICKKYGLLEKAKKATIKTLTKELEKCCYRQGTMEDGTIVTVRDIEAERKAERAKQNAFLKMNGYHWEKVTHYVGGEIEEKTCWELIREEDEMYVDVDDTLIDLGYFGEQGKIDREIKKEAKAKKEKEKEKYLDAKRTIKNYFSLNDFDEKGNRLSQKPKPWIEIDGEKYHFENEGFNIGGSGYGFIIQPLEAIWEITNNGMDGDTWEVNNYKTGGAGAIAIKYPYDEKIANMIKSYCKPGLH